MLQVLPCERLIEDSVTTLSTYSLELAQVCSLARSCSVVDSHEELRPVTPAWLIAATMYRYLHGVEVQSPTHSTGTKFNAALVQQCATIC